MRLPFLWIVASALLSLSLTVTLGAGLLRPNLPLILSAGFDSERITPNADGLDDVTTFRYELARSAQISLSLLSTDGREYRFRDSQPRLAGEYNVLFSGVVGGYLLPNENLLGTVERRLLPNGDYTWRLVAQEANGETQIAEGRLTIAESQTPLPLISAFSVAPQVFTPNQDGIADRVQINVYLEQPAELRVFLLTADGVEIPISARKEDRLPGEAGRHIFDYEGGIDLGADPPPDGEYTVVALAQDAEGQRVRVESSLTVRDGGKPRAEIVPQAVGVDVVFATMPYDERYASDLEALGELIPMPDDPADLSRGTITLRAGDMLVFKLTVENYNNVPIRTSFPPPGTVYQQDQLAASLGAFEESGAWRVGIQCETSKTSFPYRWALGSSETLMAVESDDGNTYYYLPPRSRAVVWGAVRLTQVERRQNPQTCWAGLIHEDVEVSLRNSYVGPRQVQLVDPALPFGGN